MNTPIYDFVKNYVFRNPVRLHMPGHKGNYDVARGFKDSWMSRIAKYDITEIDGADYLSAPCGIIAKSEANASGIFGCNTFYSTEGSSLCIRAMMFLLKKYAKQRGHEAYVLAGRNAHASFVNACAVLDIDVEWIMQRECDSYEVCRMTGAELDSILNSIIKKPDAVYVTSPDYLGNMLDIGELAKVCHRHGVLLLVDNAHGAYLKFLKNSLHPIDIGADMCCDSAHKTLPVLTGGAYLHIAHTENPESDAATALSEDLGISTDQIIARDFFRKNARQALSIFATTSPSYLILQSLDLCNQFLDGNTVIRRCADKTEALRKKLEENGYCITGDEPLKLTISFTEKESASNTCNILFDLLFENGIYVEYHDSEHMVMMFSDGTTDAEFEKVENVLLLFLRQIRKEGFVKKNRSDMEDNARKKPPIRAMSFKEAMFASSEQADAVNSIGRILAQPVLNCPPCVPIYMCGEVIGDDIKKYCTGKVTVVSGGVEKNNNTW